MDDISAVHSASMPPPPPPQTNSTSSRKRRLDQDGETSSVTSAKRAKLREIWGEDCWFCRRKNSAQVAHVIGKRNVRLLQDHQERHLLNFTDIHSIDNLVPLCVLCHSEFDTLDFPGLVFFPADLQFFIDFENKDFKRRKDESTQSEWPARTCANAEDYFRHQLSEGVVTEDACGGLYRRCNLRNYSETDMAPSFQLGSNTLPPKEWHGCPMASIARVFHSLGARGFVIETEYKTLLRELQDLYGEHDSELPGGKTYAAEQQQGPGDEHPTTFLETSSGRRSSRGRFRSGCTISSRTRRALSPPQGSNNYAEDAHTVEEEPGHSRSGVPDAVGERKCAEDIAAGIHEGGLETAGKRKREGFYDNTNCPLTGWSDSTVYDHCGNEERPYKRVKDMDIAWSWGPKATSQSISEFYRGIRNLPRHYEWDPVKKDLIRKQGGDYRPKLSSSPPHAEPHLPNERP